MNRKSQTLILVVPILIAWGLTDPVSAQSSIQSHGNARVGLVTATSDEDGELSELTFTCFENDGETVYPLKLDATSRGLVRWNGRRVAVTFSGSPAGKAAKVQAFLPVLTGTLLPVEPAEDGEADLEETPLGFLSVDDYEEDPAGEYAIARNPIAQRMLRHVPGRRVEVIGTLATRDDQPWLEVQSYSCVMRGQIEVPALESDEDEAEEEGDESEDPAAPPQFFCDDTGDSFGIVLNHLGRKLIKELLDTPLEVVASLSGEDLEPQLTISRYSQVYEGRISVEKDEHGRVAAFLLKRDTTKGPTVFRISPEESGDQLKGHEGQQVFLTGTVSQRGGAHWLSVRTVRS